MSKLMQIEYSSDSSKHIFSRHHHVPECIKSSKPQSSKRIPGRSGGSPREIRWSSRPPTREFLRSEVQHWKWRSRHSTEWPRYMQRPQRAEWPLAEGFLGLGRWQKGLTIYVTMIILFPRNLCCDSWMEGEKPWSESSKKQIWALILPVADKVFQHLYMFFIFFGWNNRTIHRSNHA